MTKIEIICGTYGYRPDGSKPPILSYFSGISYGEMGL